MNKLFLFLLSFCVLIPSGVNATNTAFMYNGTIYFAGGGNDLGLVSIAVTGINAKTVANTLLYTVPAGKTFIPQGVVIRATAASSISAGPTIDISTTSGGAGNIYTTTAITALDTAGKIFTFGPYGMSVSVAAAGTVYADLTAAANGTSETIEIDLIGYLE